jgi:hypothetical protein
MRILIVAMLLTLVGCSNTAGTNTLRGIDLDLGGRPFVWNEGDNVKFKIVIPAEPTWRKGCVVITARTTGDGLVTINVDDLVVPPEGMPLQGSFKMKAPIVAGSENICIPLFPTSEGHASTVKTVQTADYEAMVGTPVVEKPINIKMQQSQVGTDLGSYGVQLESSSPDDWIVDVMITVTVNEKVIQRIERTKSVPSFKTVTIEDTVKLPLGINGGTMETHAAITKLTRSK